MCLRPTWNWCQAQTSRDTGQQGPAKSNLHPSGKHTLSGGRLFHTKVPLTPYVRRLQLPIGCPDGPARRKFLNHRYGFSNHRRVEELRELFVAVSFRYLKPSYNVGGPSSPRQPPAVRFDLVHPQHAARFDLPPRRAAVLLTGRWRLKRFVWNSKLSRAPRAVPTFSCMELRCKCGVLAVR